MADTRITTADSVEIAKFSAMAEEWWDEEGTFAPLHKLNPARIAYIRDQARAHFRDREAVQDSPYLKPLVSLKGLSLLDIGCGGGLLAEPLARLGAKITAIDASERNIAMAKQHAKAEGLIIDYRCCTVEMLLESRIENQESKNKKIITFSPLDSPLFDIVLAMEIIEHVADAERFLAACAQCVKPGGLVFIATLNRTVKSLAFGVFLAEYVLRLLPRGTHDWKRFLKPSEIAKHLRAHGMILKDLTGVAYNPIEGKFALGGDIGINYILLAEKKSA